MRRRLMRRCVDCDDGALSTPLITIIRGSTGNRALIVANVADRDHAMHRLRCGTRESWQIRCRRCYAQSKREELTELKSENEWLRDEVARLKREQRAARGDIDLMVELLRLRAENERLRGAPRGRLDPEFIKRLLMLCHPDKHAGSRLATDVTQKLLALRT
ncbi:MAG: hypothetical protein ABJB97_08170 [Acidobacteriota bacterium]